MDSMQPIDMQPIMGFALILAGAVGACIGSFITLISHRLPIDEKVGATRSRCVSCKATLKLPDLIPVLSWIWLKGKCRHCSAKISARYIITEILCALGAVAILYHYKEFSPLTIALIGLWWTSVAIIVTDLEHYLIMDEYQIALAIFGLLFAYHFDADWMQVLYAVLVGAVGTLIVKYVFLFVTKRDGLGMGDVKLFGVVGIWLMSPIHFAALLVFAGVLGLVSAMLWRMAGKGNVFPFAPAIILALLLFIFLPDTYATFWQLYGTNIHIVHR
jgi:leader peptidase (prepilin peptidase)/N-methyltransferase